MAPDRCRALPLRHRGYSCVDRRVRTVEVDTSIALARSFNVWEVTILSPEMIGAITGLVGTAIGVLTYLSARRQLRRAEQAAAEAAERAKEMQARDLIVVWSNKSAESGDQRPGAWGALVHVPGHQISNALITVSDRKSAWYSKTAWSSIHSTFKWPAEKVYANAVGDQSPKPEAEDTWPDPGAHLVEITFKDTNGKFWLADTTGQRINLNPEVVVWAEGTRADALEQYIQQRFADEYGVTLVVERFATIEDLQRGMETVLRADTRRSKLRRVPDVLVAPHDWLGQIVDLERIHPPRFSYEQRRHFSPISVKSITKNRAVWGIPYVMDSVALISNTRLAGKDPLPDNLDELLAMGRELCAKPGSGVTHPFALQVGQAGDTYHSWPIFSSMGGTFFGKDDNALAFTRQDLAERGQWWDGFVAGFEKLAELGEKGQNVLRRDIGRDEALPMFLAGKTPFLVCSSRALASLSKREDLHIRTSPVPPAGPAPARSMVSVYGFFIYKHAENRRLAEHLVTQFLGLPDTGVGLSRLQPRPPVQPSAVDTIVGNYPPVKAYIDECEAGVVMPAQAGMRDIWDAFNSAEVDVISGRANAQVTATNLVTRIETILAR